MNTNYYLNKFIKIIQFITNIQVNTSLSNMPAVKKQLQVNTSSSNMPAVKKQQKKQQKEKVYKYPSPCVFCGKKLKNKQIASQHHARDCDGYFECNLCYGQYTRSGDLLRHKRNKHEGPKKECDHCGEKFLDKPLLKKHINEKHTINGKEISKPPKLCNVCEEYAHMKMEDGKHLYETDYFETWLENCQSFIGNPKKKNKEYILFLHQQIIY